jgi:hypothetical protein
MTTHPAALVLADHQPVYVTAATPPTATVRCSCNATVQWCDFATHQTEALVEAGLLADVTAVARAERTPVQMFADNIRRISDDPVLLARMDELDPPAAPAATP